MKINFNKTDEFIERLGKIYEVLNGERQCLLKEITMLSSNSCVDEVVFDMKATAARLEEQIYNVSVFRESLKKIACLCGNCEEKVKDNIDCRMTYAKAGFKSSSEITDNTSFDWGFGK